MITVTDSARDVLQAIDHPAGTVLRLEPVADDQVGLVAGQPGSDDRIIECAGTEVLRAAPPVADALDGSTIDAVETPAGTRLSINMPA